MTINYTNWEILYGKTLQEIEEKNGDKLIFTFTDGSKLTLYHDQDCCEHVRLAESIYIGGEPSKRGGYSAYYGMTLDRIESTELSHKDCTRTIISFFWKHKGYNEDYIDAYADEPDILETYWVGASNGYYSEKVGYIIEPAPTNWSTLYGRVLLSEEVIEHPKYQDSTLEQDSTIVFNFSEGYALHLLPKNMQMISKQNDIHYNSNEVLYSKTLLEVCKDPNRNKLTLTFTEGTTLTIFYEELKTAVKQNIAVSNEETSTAPITESKYVLGGELYRELGQYNRYRKP